MSTAGGQIFEQRYKDWNDNIMKTEISALRRQIQQQKDRDLTP